MENSPSNLDRGPGIGLTDFHDNHDELKWLSSPLS